MIFLIWQAWGDPLENDSSDAFGYQPIGYVDCEEMAKKVCGFDLVTKEKYGWAAPEGQPIRKFTKLPFVKKVGK